jgi:hypothetical protein
MRRLLALLATWLALAAPAHANPGAALADALERNGILNWHHLA